MPLKNTPANSPLSRHGLRPLQNHDSQQTSLSLRTIIGTTTTSASGLASHYESSSFAYCAGSAAVLAKIDDGGETSYRFFRAQPTVAPIHPNTSFYNPTTLISTPERRRRTILPYRQGGEEKFNNSTRRIWGDEGSSKTWSARERVKAASCVDLSPNGKFLAVGETGYSPRVNIFSTGVGGLSDVPLTALTEHTFGVRCVAFSPNSRWLATLGEASDGFLFIWAINPKTGAAKLSFTNKCTASVLGMAWCANNLITVGTRYVKVWRVGEPPSSFQTKQGRSFLESDGTSSPNPKTLSGRNCRLGALADCTFTCVAPISDCKAILCTETGVICLLDDSTGNQELKFLRQSESSTKSAAVDIQNQRIWFASREGQFKKEGFESLSQAGGTQLAAGSGAGEEAVVAPSCPASPIAADALSAYRSPPRSGPLRRKRHEGVIASRCLSKGVVSIDDECNICVKRWGHMAERADSEPSSVMKLPAHTGAVHGVVPLPKHTISSDFITWSSGGIVNFWSIDGSVKRSERVELEQPEPSSAEHDDYFNELRLIRASADSQWIVSGDRLGVLQVINCQSWMATKLRAHSAEITDIALSTFGESLLVATSSRDRTVQLLQYGDKGIGLLQTFDDHVGTVSAVIFVADFLISASSDRTVIIRQKVLRESHHGAALLAYVPNRVITLKASPTSITSPEPDVLVVASMDRQILSFSITTGAAVDCFKAFDAEGEDAVVLNSLNITSVENNPNSRSILAGFSSTDKSIRVYDFARGILLARELSHTEGISDVAVLEQDDLTEHDKKTLISTGLDGLIMIWDVSAAKLNLPSTPLQELSQGEARTVHDMDGTPTRDSILRRPPLRKVLSKLNLADITGLVPQGSVIREQSPSRLKKKTSKCTLVARKLNGLSTEESPSRIVPSQGGSLAEFDSNRTESPFSSSNIVMNQNTLRAPSTPPPDTAHWPGILADDDYASRRCLEERSPSPRPAPPSLPTSPKVINRANKGRLRRPPSIPADLRGQAHARPRRKSMGNVNEFGSIGMASEQVCRTLRAYRKKIKVAPRTEQLQLEELEVELLATLRAVEERSDRSGSRRTKAATESDLETLATLTETSGGGKWSGTLQGQVNGLHCNGCNEHEITEEGDRSEDRPRQQ
jgi:WD40 repeat protein